MIPNTVTLELSYYEKLKADNKALKEENENIFLTTRIYDYGGYEGTKYRKDKAILELKDQIDVLKTELKEEKLKNELCENIKIINDEFKTKLSKIPSWIVNLFN
jgi:hypothetical protein